MNQLVTLPSDSVNSHELKGKHIYKTNEHFRRLANVMEHPEFREFYNSYMNDWEDTKTIIMFMKLYEAVEKHTKITLTPYQKISIVKDMIDDPEKRRVICKEFSESTNTLTLT
jgi:uncharacterized protein involved in tellurium resistance